VSYLEDLFSLSEKVALVTGAARGNGASIAAAFVNAGAKVALVDKDAGVIETCSEINETASIGFSYPYICDLLKDDLKKVVDKIESDLGNINILVNNAGVSFGFDTLNYPSEYWDLTYKTNLKVPYELIRCVTPSMINHKNVGSIINVTSLNSELAFSNNPAYVAFKGGLKQLTKAFALDLGKYGIRCNNLGPGYIRTEMTKKSWDDSKTRKQRSDRTILGRWGIPSDLDGAAIFLASDASSYVTGQDIYVDGGWLIKGL